MLVWIQRALSPPSQAGLGPPRAGPQTEQFLRTACQDVPSSCQPSETSGRHSASARPGLKPDRRAVTQFQFERPQNACSPVRRLVCFYVGTFRPCGGAARSRRNGRNAGSGRGEDAGPRARRRAGTAGGAGRGRRPDRRRDDGRRRAQGRRRTDPQHLAERAEQPPGLGCGGEQVGHRRIGEQVLQLRGGGGGLRQPAQQPGDAARQPERLGPGRTGRAKAAARRRQRAGTDFCREAGEPLRGAAQPRPEQQHQRQGETQARRRGRRWRGAAPRQDGQNGRPGRGKRRAAWQ